MGQEIRQVNLEDDRPTVAQAMDRLRLEIRLAGRQGVKVLKLIHGFGSTGNGGKIRVAARKELMEMQKRGAVGLVIPGERLTIFEEDTRTLLRRHPAFRKDTDIDRHNNGITVIEIEHNRRKGE
ncbi:MAG: hypothetical protein ACI4PM_00295 [Butyricicoccus sp.]